jgi:hypothetical protein
MDWWIQLLARFLGLFQYGLLQPGQRLGSRVVCGSHSCPHRPHFQPVTRTAVLGTLGGKTRAY